jgi:hypothetical protein
MHKNGEVGFFFMVQLWGFLVYPGRWLVLNLRGFTTGHPQVNRLSRQGVSTYFLFLFIMGVSALLGGSFFLSPFVGKGEGALGVLAGVLVVVLVASCFRVQVL